MNRWMVNPNVTDGETLSWNLDTEGIWEDVYEIMASIESDVTEKAIVCYLREKGYTIIEPGNEDS